MSICGVGDLFVAALGIGDEDGQTQCVVFVGGAATQGVNLFNEVAPLIVVALPNATLRVANGGELFLLVILEAGLATIRVGAGQ